MNPSNFNVFVRCRPLLKQEILQGARKFPHREDTNFSCVRIVEGQQQQNRTTSMSIAEQNEKSHDDDYGKQYVGFVQQDEVEESSNSPHKNHEQKRVLSLLDPDSVLGQVRCCPLHCSSMMANNNSSSSSCIFERKFTSDGIFGPSSSNGEIFESIVKPLIVASPDNKNSVASSVLSGQNATFFFFGCTNSGKSFSVFGSSSSSPPLDEEKRNYNYEAGIVEFSVRNLCDVSFFKNTSEKKRTTNTTSTSLTNSSSTTTVHVSFVEIYNERIIDLLSDCCSNDNISSENNHHFSPSSRSRGEKSSSSFTTSTSKSHQLHREQQELFEGKKIIDLAENPQKGVFLNGVTELLVTSEEQIHTLLAQGTSRRTTSSTIANDRSSRSHAIVTLTVSTRTKSSSSSENSNDNNNNFNINKKQTQTTTAKLTFVDLAGSERTRENASSLGNTISQNRTDREGKNINKSLFALGACISALSKQSQMRKTLSTSKTLHNSKLLEDKINSSIVVPFRNSKLTRLLKDSLGGNTKTVIVATITPSVLSYNESMATLRFAEMARTVSTRAPVTVNQMKDDEQGNEMRRLYAKELETLKAEVRQLRNETKEFNLASEEKRRMMIEEKEKDKEEQKMVQKRKEQQEQEELENQRLKDAQTRYELAMKLNQENRETETTITSFPKVEEIKKATTTATDLPTSKTQRTLKEFLMLEEPQEEQEAAQKNPMKLLQQQQRRTHVPPASTTSSSSAGFCHDVVTNPAGRGRTKSVSFAESPTFEEQAHQNQQQRNEDEYGDEFSPEPVMPQQQQQRNEPLHLRFDRKSRSLKLCQFLLMNEDEIENEKRKIQQEEEEQNRKQLKSTNNKEKSTTSRGPSWEFNFDEDEDGAFSPSPQQKHKEEQQQRLPSWKSVLTSPFLMRKEKEEKMQNNKNRFERSETSPSIQTVTKLFSSPSPPPNNNSNNNNTGNVSSSTLSSPFLTREEKEQKPTSFSSSASVFLQSPFSSSSKSTEQMNVQQNNNSQEAHENMSSSTPYQRVKEIYERECSLRASSSFSSNDDEKQLSSSSKKKKVMNNKLASFFGGEARWAAEFI